MDCKLSPIHYWNRYVWLSLFLASLSMCTIKENSIESFEGQPFETELSTSPNFVGLKIEYANRYYYAVIPESDLSIFIPQGKIKSKRKDLFPILRRDTFAINQELYERFSINKSLCQSIESIDSIYGGDINNILKAFFTKEGLLKAPLSYKEELYTIYLLFMNRIYVQRDCETGYYYICIPVEAIWHNT